MAVIGTDKAKREGYSFAASEGSVRREITDVDSACNSFWAEDGTGAGGTGAEGALDAAQHSIFGQCWQWPQQDFAAGEVPGIATTGYAARTNPSSNAIAILVSFKPILQKFRTTGRGSKYLLCCAARLEGLSDSDYGLEWWQ